MKKKPALIQRRRRSVPMVFRPIDNAAGHLGQREVAGLQSNPLILAMLKQDNGWPTDDSVAWCSGFVSFTAYNTGFERSTSLRARSWLKVGLNVWTRPTDVRVGTAPPSMVADVLEVIKPGDVLIFARGSYKPDATVIKAGGHVAFYTGRHQGGNYDRIWVLGGNQGDAVSVKPYGLRDLLGVRRLRRDRLLGHDDAAARALSA